MKCPACDCCEGKEYLDKRSGKIKINLCVNCRYGLNGHKKMAKPKPKETNETRRTSL